MRRCELRLIKHVLLSTILFQTNLDSLELEASLSSISRYLSLDPTLRANSTEESAMQSTLLSLQTKEKVYTPSYAILNLNGLNLYDTDRINIGTLENNTIIF
jgi:hypothetical protein